MEQVSPGFSERYLLDPQRFQSELNEYKKYIKSMVEMAGAGNKSGSFANEILNFSTQIAKVGNCLYPGSLAGYCKFIQSTGLCRLWQRRRKDAA